MGDSLLEIIYVFNEAGRYERSVGLTDTLRNLLGSNRLSLDQDTLASIRNYLEKVDASRYTFLRNRYYPEMVEVAGYTSGMAGFRMAKYETTWWQFYLYHLATRNYYRNPGREGNNPAIFCQWSGINDPQGVNAVE